MHGTLIMKENVSSLLSHTSRISLCHPGWQMMMFLTLVFLWPQSLKLVSSEQALKELGLNEHQLRFTCRVHLQDPHSDSDTLHRIYTHLKRWESTAGGGGRGGLMEFLRLLTVLHYLVIHLQFLFLLPVFLSSVLLIHIYQKYSFLPGSSVTLYFWWYTQACAVCVVSV